NELGFVFWALHERNAEIESDGYRPKDGDHNTQAGAHGYAVVTERDVFIDGARVAEGHGPELIVGQDRHLVFGAVQELEIAAGIVMPELSEVTDAAKGEAAKAAIPAGVEPFVDWRFRARPAQHAA